MEAVPSEPVMAVDLSKSFSAPPRIQNQRAPGSDLPANPEWYHRRPAGSCVDSSYGTGSYEGDGGVEPSYVSAALPAGVYRDSDLWCPTFYQADTSCEDDSDSGSDVIVLVTAAKEPLLCASFMADGVRRIVEPLSPAPSSPGFCQRTLSSQGSDTSSEEEEVEEESESSADIPPHHARPVVLLADLGADYTGTTHSRADILSDDSDVVEVPVTQTTRKRPTFPPNKIQDKSAAGECKRSVRIRAHLVQEPPSTRHARHRLARSAKKDAVGVYYESCDSDDAMEYAQESDDDARQWHTASESDDSRQRLAGDKTMEAPETENVPRCLDTKKFDTSQQRRSANKSGKAHQRHTTTTSGNARRRHTTNKSADAGGSSTKRKLPTVPKKSVKRKRRKRRAWCPPSSLFSTPEPQIKLRCTSAQEPAKKKKKTSDNFCPFVQVRRRARSQWNGVTVVNQQDVPQKKQQNATRSFYGVMPKSSCFRLGRLNGAVAAPPSCSLCGRQANADGQGDLHGPYLPAAGSLAKMPDCHDDGAARHLGERWVHSDCCVWSSKVFLVRGNLYGLEEAEQLARDTVCCWCHQSGAIMGCSHKGCTRSLHYACARPSGCALNEDNLSLRCSQHHLSTCQQQQHEGHTQCADTSATCDMSEEKLASGAASRQVTDEAAVHITDTRLTRGVT